MTHSPGAHEMVLNAACMQDLHALTSLVEQACREVGASEEALFSLRLAVEEVFTNILDYGYKDSTGPVAIRIEARADQVQVSFVDAAPLFDPATVPEPKLDVPLEERQVGGWGWHFVREAVDRVAWEPHQQGGNLLTLLKKLPPGSSPQKDHLPMNIEIKQHGKVSVICVTGSVDGTTAPMLTAELHGCVTSGSVWLVADLAGVDYTSSVGLRTLLATMKETRVQAGDLRLCSVTPHVLKVLELSGFTSIMKLYDDVDSAVESYSV